MISLWLQRRMSCVIVAHIKGCLSSCYRQFCYISPARISRLHPMILLNSQNNWMARARNEKHNLSIDGRTCGSLRTHLDNLMVPRILEFRDKHLHMDGSTSHFYNAKLGQIHTTLKALEKKAWIHSTIHVQEDRHDKRVYIITAEGRDNLKKWLAEPLTEMAPHKNALLLKLFFAAQTDKKTLIALLHLQKNLHRRQADSYRTETRDMIQSVLQQNPALEKDGLFWEAARRFGELFEETYVKWLDETINSLEKNL